MFESCKNISPLLKLLTFLNCSILVFAAPIHIALIIGTACYCTLVLYNGHKSVIVNPHYIFLFIILSAVLVIIFFKNSKEDIHALINFSIRLFGIMTTAALAGLFFTPYDFIDIFRLGKVPEKVFPFILAFIRFLPVTIKDLTTIIFAQRARGLKFSIKYLFVKETYLSIIIPYINSILANVIVSDIGIKIKNFSLPRRRHAIGLFDILFILINILLCMASLFLPEPTVLNNII